MYCVFLDFDCMICVIKVGVLLFLKNFREFDFAGLRRACEFKSRDVDLVGLFILYDVCVFVIMRNLNVEVIEVYLKIYGVCVLNVCCVC